jgi:hypothetical protein
MRFTSEVSFDLKGDKQRAASYIPFVRTLIKVVENVFTTKGLGSSETFTFRREIAPGVEVSIFYGAPYPSVTITASSGGGENQGSIKYIVRPLWEPEGFLVSYPGVNILPFVDSFDYFNRYPFVPFPPCAIINRYRNNKYGDKLVKDSKILPILDKPYLVSWLPLIHAKYTEKDKTEGLGIYKLVKSVTSEGITVSKPVRLLSDKYSLPKEEETGTWFLHEPEIYTPPVHSFQVLLDLINELRQQIGTAENDLDKARPFSFPFRGHGDLAYIICDEIVRSGLFSSDPGYRDPYKTANSRACIDTTVFPMSSNILGENIASVSGSVKSDNSALTVFKKWKESPEDFNVMTNGDYAASRFNYNLGQGPRYNPAAHIFARSDVSGALDVSTEEKVSGHVWALDIRAQHSFAVAGDLVTWEDAEGSERITMRSYAPTVFFDPVAVWSRSFEFSLFFYKGRAVPVSAYNISDYFRNTPYVLLGAGKKKTGSKNLGFYAVIAVREGAFQADLYRIRYFLLYLPEHADPWTGWRILYSFYDSGGKYIRGVSTVYFNASCTEFVFGHRSRVALYDYDFEPGLNHWFRCEFTHDDFLVVLLSQKLVNGLIYAWFKPYNLNDTYIVRYGYIGDNLVYSYLHVNNSLLSEDVINIFIMAFITCTCYVREYSMSWVLYSANGSSLILVDINYTIVLADHYFSLLVGTGERFFVSKATGFTSRMCYTNYLHGPTFVPKKNITALGDIAYTLLPSFSLYVYYVHYNDEMYYLDGTMGNELVWFANKRSLARDVVMFTGFPYILNPYYDYIIDDSNGYEYSILIPYPRVSYAQVCLTYKNEHFSSVWIKPGFYASNSPGVPPIVRSSLPPSLIAGRFPIGVI